MSDAAPPPFQFVPPIGISTSSGTWDDWLAMRPRPAPEPGENSVSLSAADYVAAVLATGHPEAVDFAMETARTGMRDLFTEFEEATRGQTVLWRKPEVRSSEVELTTARTPENRVRVALIPKSGAAPVAIDLDLEQATLFARCFVAEVEKVAGQEG